MSETLQFILHYGGHFLAPFLVARLFCGEKWGPAALIMLATNAIDLDHLMASPVFDPDRCSVGFHLLHGWEAALAFTVLLLIPRWWVRAIGLGALWHLAVDFGDCAMHGF